MTANNEALAVIVPFALQDTKVSGPDPIPVHQIHEAVVNLSLRNDPKIYTGTLTFSSHLVFCLLSSKKQKQEKKIDKITIFKFNGCTFGSDEVVWDFKDLSISGIQLLLSIILARKTDDQQNLDNNNVNK